MTEARYEFDESTDGTTTLEVRAARDLKELARQQAGDAISYGLAGGLAVVFLGLFGGMMWTKRYTRDLMGTVIDNLTFTLPASLGLGVPVGLGVFGAMLAGTVWQRRGLLAGDRPADLPEDRRTAPGDHLGAGPIVVGRAVAAQSVSRARPGRGVRISTRARGRQSEPVGGSASPTAPVRCPASAAG